MVCFAFTVRNHPELIRADRQTLAFFPPDQ